MSAKADAVRRWRQKQGELGLCHSCTEPRVEGLTRCEKHRMIHREYKDARHASRMRRMYGVDYAALEAEQNGLCAICAQPETTRSNGEKIKRLSVDHCHETGRVRGLLCNNCNRAIGLLKDDVDMLERAAAYLRGVVG